MVEKYKTIAKYLGWIYVPSRSFYPAGWYKPYFGNNSTIINGKLYARVCRNNNELLNYLSLDSLFGAIEKIENENTDFGYSWENLDGKTLWNNVGIVFSMFNGRIDFCMERQLDPAETISERNLNYSTLKEDLVELICEVLKYLENGRV